MLLQPGAVVGGKYRLDRLLGQGGMGSVYAAENTLTGKLVAIKCMHQEIAANPEAAKRFLREARASARVRHPNVVDVYDVLSEGEACCLVMEFLEGEPLSALMDRETTPLPHLIKLLLGAMRGVAAAHRQGIIHRDIKPENIFLSNEGDERNVVPKVLDFGISKLNDAQDMKMTAPGSALGTLLYMSTEQLTGAADIDSRADVYAFGVILYQAVTGRPPFDSDTLSVLILRIMTEQPAPIRELRPDLPDEFVKVIESAMAKKREERLPNMEALIRALEPFAEAKAFRDPRSLSVSRVPAIRTPNSAAPPSERSAAEVAAMQEKAAYALTGQQGSRLSPTPFTVSSAPPRIPRNPMRHVPLIVLGLVGLVAAGFWFLRPAQPAPAEKDPANVVMPAPHQVAAAEPELPPAGAEPVSAPPSAAGPAGPNGAAPGPGRAAAPPPPKASPLPGRGTAPAPQPTAADPERRARKPAAPALPVVPDQVVPAPAPRPKPNCNPNFYFDAQGEKHFKPECF
jgi:eukaryotic-like serine/threonine-protein kinase